ncbi:hypothetical protein AWR38_06180 [Idiomarina sp. WRN-38]|nr:hypothetical protein AUR68_06165 [Idiomarina sp. H105]OAE91004.1 hypothetical protein AWR38_06180 [Idiomarina sp. WRN-38]
MTNEKSKALKFFSELPIFGNLFVAANGYVLRGDNSFVKKVAPWRAWVCIFVDLLWAASLGAISSAAFCFYNVSNVNAASLIQAFTPSFIGVSVGIYALVFVVPTLVTDDSFKELESSMKSISFNMSYPILALVFILLLSVFTGHLSEGKYSNFINLSLLFYSFMLVMEVVTYVAYFGRSIVSRRIREMNGKQES